MFKLTAAMMTVLFAYAISVQFNDPDALYWVAIYAVSVVMSVAAFFNAPIKIPLFISLGLYSIIIALLSPFFLHTTVDAFLGISMKGLEQELVRELWGMVICWCWNLLLLVRQFKKTQPKNQKNKCKRAVEI
jgi:hypothetical protein